MGRRDTTTGSHFEDIVGTIIERSCVRNNLTAIAQVDVGTKPGGGRHYIDYEITLEGTPTKKGLVSCKVQNVSGSAEEKIAYEVIKLLDLMKKYPVYAHSWLILGGDGWSSGMKTFIFGELIPNWFADYRNKITIYDTNQLITRGVAL